MRSINIDSLNGGEILAKSIYDDDGRVLIRSGTAIRTTYFKKLREFGIEYIYIEDSDTEGIVPEEVISEETRNRGKQEVKKVFKDYIVSDRLDFTRVYDVVNDLLDEILNNKQVVLNVADLKNKNETIYEHCMSVCILASSVGSYIFDQRKLKELTLGALVHDIGLMLVPEEILNKPDKLSPEEFEIIKGHPKLGHDILAEDSTFPLISRNVVFMHHEKCDGSGYPLGVNGRQLHDVVKLVTICDMFDAMITPKPYRKQMKTFESFETLTSMVGTQIDKKIYKEFEKHVALYPVGKAVVLNNGYKGIVAAQNQSMPARPIVRLLYDEQGKKLDNYIDLDLTKELTTFIVDILEI